MMTRSFRAALAVAALLAAADTLQAQGAAGEHPRRSARRVPVTVALVDRLPQPDAPFVILRRAGRAPHDVILLPAGADAARLSQAVNAMAAARLHGGDVPGASAVLRARPRADGPAPARVLPWAQRVVDDLRVAETRTIPGVGTVRAVEIWLPPQRRTNPRRSQPPPPRS